MVGRPLIAYFWSKISLGYKNLRGNLKINHFKPLFEPIPQLDPSLVPPHFEDNWIFLTFHLSLIYRNWISKNLAGFGLS